MLWLVIPWGWPSVSSPTLLISCREAIRASSTFLSSRRSQWRDAACWAVCNPVHVRHDGSLPAAYVGDKEGYKRSNAPLDGWDVLCFVIPADVWHVAHLWLLYLPRGRLCCTG